MTVQRTRLGRGGVDGRLHGRKLGPGVPNTVRIGRTLLTYPARSIASAPTGNGIVSSRKVPGVRLEIDGFRASVPTESPISPRARLVSSR